MGGWYWWCWAGRGLWCRGWILVVLVFDRLTHWVVGNVFQQLKIDVQCVFWIDVVVQNFIGRVVGRVVVGRAIVGRAVVGRAVVGRAVVGRAVVGRAVVGRVVERNGLFQQQ
jgi:hypothetical protein